MRFKKPDLRAVDHTYAALAVVCCAGGFSQAAFAQLAIPEPEVSAEAAVPADAEPPADPATEATLESSAADESAATEEEAASAPMEIEEIVVTAQRRKSTLEKTPVSVSALSADDLASQGIVSEADLQRATPGLLVRQSVDSNQLNYVIRGQSVDAFTSSQPAVAVYLNEIAVPGASSSVFYDYQSVQVLKGPQGTLFGRNSTGGAVLLTTRKPTNDHDGYITVRAGDYDQKQVEGAVNFPFADGKILTRIAGYAQERDGFQKNYFDDSTVGDSRRNGVRLSLSASVTDTIQNELVIDGSYSGGESTSGVAYSANFGGGLLPATVIYSPALDTLPPFYPGAPSGPGTWNQFLALHPSIDPAGYQGVLDAQRRRGPFDIDVNARGYHHAENLRGSNITTIEAGDETQIKNVFGYANTKTHDSADLDGSPFGIIENGTDVGRQYRYKGFSDELQLLGTALDKQLSYVTGLYYFTEERRFIAETQNLELLPIFPATVGSFNAKTKTHSYAVYAQGTYDLSEITSIEGLGVTAGLRHTSEKITLRQLPGSSVYDLPAPYSNVLDQSTKKLSYQFGVQEQLNDDLLLYGVTRRSFRSGGFNETAAPLDALASQGGAGFEPETASDIELGLKLKSSLAGMPTRLNLAVYQQWVDKIQRSVYGYSAGTPAGFTINVPKAKISGFELDGRLVPAGWLDVGASVAYTDARFTDSSTEVFGVPAEFGPFADTPKWSGSAFAEAWAPLAAKGYEVSFRGDVFAQSHFFFGSQNDTTGPGTRIPGYAIVNLHLALKAEDAGWSVSANLKNALDRVHYVGGVALGSILGINSAIPGEPRTVTVELKYEF